MRLSAHSVDVIPRAILIASFFLREIKIPHVDRKLIELVLLPPRPSLCTFETVLDDNRHDSSYADN
jgi:hypothetical protein